MQHNTKYTYETPARELTNEITLTPGQFPGQTVLHHEIRTLPSSRPFYHSDVFLNQSQTFYIPTSVLELTVRADSLVLVNRAPTFPEIMWGKSDYAKGDIQEKYYLYVMPTLYCYPIPELSEWLGSLWEDAPDLSAFLLTLTKNIKEQFQYVPGATDVESDVQAFYTLKAGVCQDFTHWMLAALRSLGIPCRYVSGYIYDRAGVLLGTQAMHAWVDVLVHDDTWVGLDPTNGCIAGESHVYLSVGRDYRDIVPIKGVYKGTLQTMEVDVKVQINSQS